MGYRAKGSVVSICPGRAKEGLSLSVMGDSTMPDRLYLSLSVLAARSAQGSSVIRPSERALHVEQKDVARYLQGSAVIAPGARGAWITTLQIPS